MAFFRKKDDFEAEKQVKIFEELKVQGIKLAKLEAYMEALEQKLKMLRGLVNRKMRLGDETPTEKHINSEPFESLRGNIN